MPKLKQVIENESLCEDEQYLCLSDGTWVVLGYKEDQGLCSDISLDILGQSAFTDIADWDEVYRIIEA